MAESIGYPVIIKARLGGGGRGMRIVYKAEDLENAYTEARQEAKVCLKMMKCIWNDMLKIQNISKCRS